MTWFWLALLLMCGLIVGRMPLAAVLGFSHKTSFAESVYKASRKTYGKMLVFSSTCELVLEPRFVDWVVIVPDSF